MAGNLLKTRVSTAGTVTKLGRKAIAYKMMYKELARRMQDMVAIYRMVVEQVVYLEHPPGAVDGPKVYKRTYRLLNSITAEPIETGQTRGIRIYFDPQVSAAWDGFGSYSVYVPLSTGFLTNTRHWTSDWRKRAYDAVLELCSQVLEIARLE